VNHWPLGAASETWRLQIIDDIWSGYVCVFIPYCWWYTGINLSVCTHT